MSWVHNIESKRFVWWCFPILLVLNNSWWYRGSMGHPCLTAGGGGRCQMGWRRKLARLVQALGGSLLLKNKNKQTNKCHKKLKQFGWETWVADADVCTWDESGWRNLQILGELSVPFLFLSQERDLVELCLEILSRWQGMLKNCCFLDLNLILIANSNKYYKARTINYTQLQRKRLSCVTRNCLR